MNFNFYIFIIKMDSAQNTSDTISVDEHVHTCEHTHLIQKVQKECSPFYDVVNIQYDFIDVEYFYSPYA